MIRKITEEERELLIIKRIERIDKDQEYAKQLFETWYKDSPVENVRAWRNSSPELKRKIVEEIIKKEDKGMVGMALKMSPIKWKEKLSDMKHQQLVEWGVRQDGDNS